MVEQVVKADPATERARSMDAERILRIERFLYHEAELMDAHDYDRWFDLWHGDDVLYWVPCNSDDQDPATAVAIIYDDRERLTERMMRLKDKLAHAYRPRARLIRAVSNVVPLAVEGDELEVASAFVLGEIRVGVHHIWFGKSIHRLKETPDGFRIRRKKVMLLNNDEPMPNLTFLV